MEKFLNYKCKKYTYTNLLVVFGPLGPLDAKVRAYWTFHLMARCLWSGKEMLFFKKAKGKNDKRRSHSSCGFDVINRAADWSFER